MQKDHNTINIGDIIFQSLKDEVPFSHAVRSSGMQSHQDISEINHVGIAIGDNVVIDASRQHGVSKKSLSQFLSMAKFNLVATITDSNLIQPAIKRLNRYLSSPYNDSFYPDADGFYCSELVTHAFKTQLDEDYFQQYPMNFLDAKTQKLLPYWVSYYKQLKKTIPQGFLGSHPQQLLSQTERFKSIKKIEV